MESEFFRFSNWTVRRDEVIEIYKGWTSGSGYFIKLALKRITYELNYESENHRNEDFIEYNSKLMGEEKTLDDLTNEVRTLKNRIRWFDNKIDDLVKVVKAIIPKAKKRIRDEQKK